VARLARERLGAGPRVVGVDVSAPMLEVARGIEPSIDWREGSAAALPIGTAERFDRVLCQQGIQFFGDRAAAAAELRRAMASGGRVLAAVWRGAEEMPVFAALQRVAERHVGPIRDDRYGFGDAKELKKLLTDAGFGRVQVDTASLVCRFSNGAEFVRMNTMALVGMSGARVSDEQRERLLEAITGESMEAAQGFFDGATLVCEMRTNLAVAS
jgi:ubiquinone/menaquinone biosynthesis C-methylase UbiE